MSKNSLQLLIFAAVSFWSLSCGVQGQTKALKLSYSVTSQVIDSSWFQIDDIVFIHTPHNFEWESESILSENDVKYTYVPTSYVYFYHPNQGEKRVQEKITNFQISLEIWKRLKNIRKDGQKVYLNVHPKEMMVTGRVSFIRSDGKPIKFLKSQDCTINHSYVIPPKAS